MRGQKNSIVIKQLFDGYLGTSIHFDSLVELEKFTHRTRGTAGKAIYRNLHPVIRDGKFKANFYVVVEANGKKLVDHDELHYILEHFSNGRFKSGCKSKNIQIKLTPEESAERAKERIKWLTYFNENYGRHITDQATKDPNFVNLQKAYGAFD